MNTLDRIVDVLSRIRVRVHNEAELEDVVAQVLDESGFSVTRQALLLREGRIDLLVNARVGVELKVEGSATSVIRQLHRYAHSGLVDGLVLVTSRQQHKPIATVTFPVPVRVVCLGGFL